jgi:threonine synthase
VIAPDENPFVRYRRLLESYPRQPVGIEGDTADGADAAFVQLVQELDAAVAEEGGQGFVVTPFTAQARLAQQIGLDGVDLWVKDDTGNVGGSHKGRHLFGLLLHLWGDRDADGHDLAIASCGNAALAAAVIAAAVGRHLRVFIPTDADPAVVAELERHGADIAVSPRHEGVHGDPAYHALQDALRDGAVAFSCQGTDAPGTIDGGRTIAWEMAEQLADAFGAPARLDRVFVQVGGGALGSAIGRGFVDAMREGWISKVPALHAVQTSGAFPLVRAWDLLAENIAQALGVDVPPIVGGADRARVAALLHEHRDSAVVDQWIAHATAEPDRYMWAWEETPQSVATGILDDLTYDWIGVAEAMIRTGGWPVVVDETTLVQANEAARAATGIDVDITGSAGLAGLIECARARGGGSNVPAYGERVAVLFTGVRRG